MKEFFMYKMRTIKAYEKLISHWYDTEARCYQKISKKLSNGDIVICYYMDGVLQLEVGLTWYNWHRQDFIITRRKW